MRKFSPNRQKCPQWRIRVKTSIVAKATQDCYWTRMMEVGSKYSGNLYLGPLKFLFDILSSNSKSVNPKLTYHFLSFKNMFAKVTHLFLPACRNDCTLGTEKILLPVTGDCSCSYLTVAPCTNHYFFCKHFIQNTSICTEDFLSPESIKDCSKI